MLYGELDLGSMERAAYQRGDADLAAILAQLEDSLSDAQEAEEAIYEKEQRAQEAEAKLAQLKREVEQIADEIGYELDSAKRCGNREAISAAIQKLYEIGV